MLSPHHKLADRAQAFGNLLSGRHEGRSQPMLTAQAKGNSAPVSFAQARLWFLCQMKNINPAYNIPSAVLITGPFRRDLLNRVFSCIVERHAVLRTRFVVEGGEPVQIVDEAQKQVAPVIDLS